MNEVSKSLRSAQQSMAQAGQSGQGNSGKKDEQSQDGQGQGQGQGKRPGDPKDGQSAGQEPGEGEATDEQMGREFTASGGQNSGSDARDSSNSRRKGSGRGQAGQGAGGNVGAQQPLPGAKKDRLVRGTVNERGKQLSRSFMGTPDPTQDKAAYYSVVPERSRAAESSLNREEIPAGYKKTVRDYFRSINPR